MRCINRRLLPQKVAGFRHCPLRRTGFRHILRITRFTKRARKKPTAALLPAQLTEQSTNPIAFPQRLMAVGLVITMLTPQATRLARQEADPTSMLPGFCHLQKLKLQTTLLRQNPTGQAMQFHIAIGPLFLGPLQMQRLLLFLIRSTLSGLVPLITVAVMKVVQSQTTNGRT